MCLWEEGNHRGCGRWVGWRIIGLYGRWLKGFWGEGQRGMEVTGAVEGIVGCVAVGALVGCGESHPSDVLFRVRVRPPESCLV